MSDRIFRALLRLLPAEFRGDYGREMEATFRVERRAAASTAAVVRLWLATAGDILRTAPSEHLDILRRDLSYSIRMLVRRPMLTMSAMLTLALGIGANTAIFSVVNGVLLAPLPYPDPDRLVLVQEQQSGDQPGTTGYLSFDALRAQQSSFDSLAAMGGWSATLTGNGAHAERVLGARVTWEYFRTLRVQPALGRDFDRQEDQPTRRRVVLLSDNLWRRRFNADPGVLGRSIAINGVDYTVAGVMPRTLTDLVTTRIFPGTEVWTLLGYAPELPQACRTCRHMFVLGRVASGVAIESAQADLTRVYQSLVEQYPREYRQSRAVLTPVREHFLGPVRRALLVLWGAVGVLLLIACANVANLLLIRASEREEEIAIRRALGVRPVRLLRQLLTESVLLAALGGAAGVVLAWWGTALLVAHGPESIPRLAEVAPDARVLLYALAISLATGVLFGMAPARVLITRVSAGVATHTRRVTADRGAWRYRAALVTANVALSAVLLVASGLLVRSFVRLLSVDPGFNPQSVLTVQIDVGGQKYADINTIAEFYRQVAERLGGLPGVVSVAGATQLPLSGNIDQWGITIEGREPANPAESPEADRYGVAGDYFAVMNVPLLRGRVFTAADGAGAPPVVVIGKTMADRLWPGEDPIGHRVRLAGGPDNPFRTIVGVVDDVRHYGLHLPATMQAHMPHAQSPWRETMMTMLVRVREGQDPLTLAAAAREQVRAVDPLQPVMKIRSYDAIVAASMATRRFTLGLLVTFAVTALVLAAIGLYGALSYVVSQRQKEIGVRVALGAGAREIRRLVVGQGIRPAAAGLLLGLLVALAAASVLDSMLFAVRPTDVATFASVFAILAVSAFAACLLPATRAARIDPAAALRSE